MLKVSQSSAQHNPCKDVFKLAASAYSAHDLVAESILERWWQAHPSMFYLAYENESLCGYISAFPLTSEAFQTTLKPDFDEKTLEPASVFGFEVKGDYQMYFSSIVVHSNWRRKGVSRILRKSFLNDLIVLWLEGMCVTRLSSLVVSTQGATMMKSLGMHVISRCPKGNIFYAKHSKKSLDTCLHLLT